MPSDGSASPIDLTQALANGRATGVRTDQGTITADFVVNTGGMWARDLGRQSGVSVPLHACEHYCLVTEAVPDLLTDLPVLRSYCDGPLGKKARASFSLVLPTSRSSPGQPEASRTALNSTTFHS